MADPTELYLVPRGEKIQGTPSFSGDHVESISVSWLDGSTIEVKARRARISWQTSSQEVKIGANITKVTLQYSIGLREP